MSENCNNPDCPEHGNNPTANSRREARQAIVTNEELMGMIRVVAGNVSDAINQSAAKIGAPVTLADTMATAQIIEGLMDDDPMVQGVIDGFCMLYVGSEPFRTMVAETAEVKEEPFFQERQKKAFEESGEAERIAAAAKELFMRQIFGSGFVDLVNRGRRR